MAKVSFSLIQNRFIAISFYHKFGRFRTLTGQTIDQKFWNQRTGRARGDSKFPEYLQLNHLLGTYETRIQDFYRTCLINQAGINRSRVVAKYELITTHTARRSFATNAVKAGIPAMDIMRITGHKTEASFRRYICIDDEESALAMAGSRFFN